MGNDKDLALKNALDFFDGSELAATTYLNKYALKDKEGNFLEIKPLDTIARVMKVLADAMPEEKDIDAFYDESGKATCKLSCPSEEWLKRVLKEEYSLYRSDRRYHWLEIFGKACNNFKGVCPQGSVLAAAGDDTRLQSLSNCFVVPPPSDTMSGIMRTNDMMANIYKRRGGCGVDLSSLRPENASVNNAALKSSGAVGWANHFSNTCRDVAQNGRRGASMLTLNIKHPDSEKWAKMKEDLAYCTGSNVSLWITDEFMNAVEKDQEFELKFPIDANDPIVTKKVKAKDLWNTICTSAHKMAEPGLLNWDTITKTLPAHFFKGYEVVSTNPCIPKWVKLLTKTGMIGLEHVNVGDQVWSKEGWTTVINKQSSGVKKVFKYHTKGGSFYGTEDHKIISNGEKIKVKDAISIDLLTGDSKKVQLIPEDIMSGLMVGDGCWHKASKKAVLYVGKDDLDYHSSEIKDLIVKKCSVGRYCWDVITSLSQEDFLKTYEKVVPFKYLYGSKEQVCSFLRGIYSANGSVVGNRVSFKTNSFKLCEQLQVMLSSVGISSYYTTNKEQKVKFYNGVYTCKESYDLNINKDKEIFFDNIGFLQEYKNKKLYLVIEKKALSKFKPCKVSYEIISKDFISEEEVFDITVNNNSHTFWMEGLDVANCSEISLGSYDACRLISIGLLEFVVNPFTKESYFDFEKFEKYIRITVNMGEALVRAENNKIKQIIGKITNEQNNAPEDKKIEYDLEIDLWKQVLEKGEKGRRLGLGDHGWGDMFAQLRIKYDSKESLELAEKIKKTYRDVAYDESVELAKQYGHFDIWDWEVEKECEFFKTFPKNLLDKMKKYGRRHISLLTNAPTGTISLIGQCSSGIEPTFRHMYIRRRKINSNDKDSRVDFIDQSGDKWMEFPVFEKNIERYFRSIGKEIPDVKSEDELNELLPKYFITSDRIDWKKRIDFQATLSKYVDHSISSTINLSAETSVETVKDLYMYAWKKGLKGVTVYRDGCRSGVLVTKNSDKISEIIRAKAPERPIKLPCEVHFTKVKGIDYVVIVGILNGSVYEVFCGEYSNQIPKKQFSGYIERKKRGEYYLCFLDEEVLQFREIDINQYFDNTEYASATRLISMSLSHGVPLEKVIEQLKKSSVNITEFGSAVSRALKKYIKLEDLKNVYSTCSSCGSTDIEIKYESGCYSIVCKDCNFVDSKCG